MVSSRIGESAVSFVKLSCSERLKLAAVDEVLRSREAVASCWLLPAFLAAVASCQSALDLDDYTFAAQPEQGVAGSASNYAGAGDSGYVGGVGPAAGGRGSSSGAMEAQTTGGTGGQLPPSLTPGIQETGSAGSNTGAASSVGGTSNAGGMSSAVGGTGGDMPAVSGGCVDVAETGTIALQVLVTERESSTSISMILRVDNAGADFPVSDLVLRYWFSDDGLDVSQAEVDFASNNLTSSVDVRFGETLGSNYADIAFLSGADIGDGIDRIQVRLHTPNYSPVDQSNDFSYAAAGATELVNPNVTAYVDGAKVFGCEPDP